MTWRHGTCEDDMARKASQASRVRSRTSYADEHRAQINDLQADNGVLTSTIKGLQKKVEAKTNTIGELRDTVKAREATITGLNTTVTEHAHTIAGLQHEIVLLERELNANGSPDAERTDQNNFFKVMARGPS